MPVAAAFIYLPNAKVAYISFVSVDPDLPKRAAFDAIRTVLAGAMEIAEEFLRGAGFVELVTHHPLTPRLAVKEFGFRDSGTLFNCFKLVGSGIDEKMITPYD